MLTNVRETDTIRDVVVVAAVSPAWSGRYGAALARHGIAARFVADGAALNDALIRDWSVGLVILDLALAVPELAHRLGLAGPRVLAFGDPAHAGLALAANLADFIDDEPNDDRLLAAVDAAVQVVADVGVADLSDRTSAQLGALGREAERVASALARLDGAATANVVPVSSAMVRALIRARQARDRFFPAELFGEPAWDMLLDLYVARLEDRDVSVSSLCIAARVPTTTALRWIRTLCDAALFERRNDPADARRAFVSLAPGAATMMSTYLGQFGQPGV